MKFKVGDRVRIISVPSSLTDKEAMAGDVGIVRFIDGVNPPIAVQIDRHSDDWFFYPTNLEFEAEATVELHETVIVHVNEYPKLTTLPTDSAERKNYPMHSGCLKYFPAALAGVSKISKLGNDKHNPGEPLHHARGKSTDHGDCIVRHLTDVEDLLAAFNRVVGGVHIDHRSQRIEEKEKILLEVNQLAWRVLAYSQEIHERFGAPLAPGAIEPKPKT